jgi:hypothetical protein
MDKVYRRLSRQRINHIGPDVNLIKGDSRGRDGGHAACFSPKYNKGNKDVLAIYKGRLEVMWDNGA